MGYRSEFRSPDRICTTAPRWTWPSIYLRCCAIAVQSRVASKGEGGRAVRELFRSAPRAMTPAPSRWAVEFDDLNLDPRELDSRATGIRRRSRRSTLRDRGILRLR